MKAICYTRHGRLEIVRPTEGARLAHSITLADGSVGEATRPIKIDEFLRQWPVKDVIVGWAETEDEFVARIAAKDVPPDASNVQIIDEADIPADRTFRDVWQCDGQKLTIDMEKARALHMNRIREARVEKLAALDREFMRATGRKNQAEADQIEAKREALRNIPQTFDLSKAETPEELKALWPEELAV